MTEVTERRNFYGRIRGKTLRASQKTYLAEGLEPLSLPSVTREANPSRAAIDLTFTGGRPLWLEIGFGGGEHLIWQAVRHPDVTLIGCEPFEDGVVKVLTAIEEQNLGNIRLRGDDVRPLLRALPPQSIDRAFVLFPDPWPKRKHVKRRLVSKPLLDLLARVLRPGAELRIATDIGDYLRTMLIALMAHPDFAWAAARPGDWRVRPDDWPETRYEQKALREGRRGYFLRFRRRGCSENCQNHVAIPVMIA